MNTGVTKTDFIYFQNDILKDLKNLEVAFNEKTEKIIKAVENNKSYADSNFTKYSLLISELSDKLGESEENSQVSNQLKTFQKKLEDLSINSRIKTNTLEKEINNMTVKYDKIFINNLVVPGLIGSSCPFPTLSSFVENANKKINELVVEKKKQGMDLKTYKEKLESLIGMFNNRVNNSEEKFKEYCNLCFNNFDKNSNDRFNALEERMGSLRMENVKYSSELIERSNELKTDWDKIMNIKTEIYDKLNSELEKYAAYNNNLLKIFESQKSEFALLKKRFTELSEFIKDVRFRNNLTSIQKNNNTNSTNSNNNIATSPFQKKVKFTQMSKRINFKLKQELDDSFKLLKSHKHLTKLTRDYDEKRENSFHYSPAKTEFHFDNNDSDNSSEIHKDDDEEKDKELSLDNKDINNDKNNEEEKINPINKEYIVNKPMELEKVRSTIKNYFNSNKSFKSQNLASPTKLSSIKKRHKTNIHGHENILNKNKNFELKKNKSFVNKDSENELSGEERRIKSILNKKNEVKTLKTKEVIIKDEISKTNSVNKLKLNVKPSPKFIDSPKINRKNKFNKTLKIPEIQTKERGKNKLKTYIKSAQIKINVEENIDEKNNTKKENNQQKIKIFPKSRNNSPIKIDAINLINENKNKNNKVNVVAENKFTFLTNPEIKEKEKEIPKKYNINKIDDININTNGENFNLDMDILNKKIINTNNRLTELYMNSDIKINKIYQYVKKVFDHFSGIFFFKEIYNQKFSFDFSPKSILTNTDFTSTLPATRNNKTKIKLKENNKFFSPKNLKKQETYKSIVDKIEPYLIKKFKE